MPGTELAYAATRQMLPALHRELPPYARAKRCPVLSSRMVLPPYAFAERYLVQTLRMRVPYALCDTELQYAATVCSTGRAYGATASLRGVRVCCYAVSGIHVAYAAMPCPVLSYGTQITPYWHSGCGCAMSGTA
eukprot:3941554-Rhodomonas_salina.5